MSHIQPMTTLCSLTSYGSPSLSPNKATTCETFKDPPSHKTSDVTAFLHDADSAIGTLIASRNECMLHFLGYRNDTATRLGR
jgi:hypothetical protein